MRLTLATFLLFLVAAPANADGTLVSIAVTSSGDGVLTVPVGGDAAFAVAVGNFGQTAVLIIPTVAAVRAVVVGQTPGLEPLPLTAFICHTAPPTGQCLQLGVGNLVTLGPGEVATYSVFVHASGAVDFQPGTTRIVATLNGQYPIHLPGAPYTSASVAVRTAP